MATVKVRIAVAVDRFAQWSAYGHSDLTAETEDEMREAMVLDGLADGEQIHWIEAHVPIPEPETIEGRIVAAANHLKGSAP